MKVTSVTITAEASASFQKGCASFTIQPDDGLTNVSPDDIIQIEKLAIQESVKIVKGIIPNIPESQIQTRSMVTPKPITPAMAQKMVDPVGGYDNNDGYCTPKQAAWLVKYLQMDPNAAKVLHYKEANQLIKEYCQTHSLTGHCKPRNNPDYNPNQYNGRPNWRNNRQYQPQPQQQYDPNQPQYNQPQQPYQDQPDQPQDAPEEFPDDGQQGA